MARKERNPQPFRESASYKERLKKSVEEGGTKIEDMSEPCKNKVNLLINNNDQ